MKNAIKLFSLLTVVFVLFSFTPTETQHIGRWKGITDDEVGYFTYDKDGYATMEMEGQTIGGKSFVMEGITAQMTYTVDYKAKPIQLDMIVSDKNSGEELMRIKSIIEFISADKMKMAVGDDPTSRPTAFTESNSVVFDREK